MIFNTAGECMGFTLNTAGSVTVPGRWTMLALCGYEPAILAALLEVPPPSQDGEVR
jgi:hypothetical protein